ncbi:PAS domain-containing protein [Kiloniella sp. EL199]|uniref:PAS domain-containing protein n=1 Tax=Kiloniella sp. EL199 TaxID=2107581 RepID=UPI0020B11450|nr:PAS domain-containing protein [Kiloniella sp. EL199]
MKIRNARNRQFYDYWQSLEKAEGTVMPKRSSFRPGDIPSLLPNISIYELISRENIKIRLQGTAINERLGHNMTGLNYLDYVEDDRKTNASKAFWLMAEQPCGIHAVLVHALSSGRNITVEAIGFPLHNDILPLDGSTPNPIIIYQSNEIDNQNPLSYQIDERLKLILVVERNIIDIGKGAPVFVD